MQNYEHLRINISLRIELLEWLLSSTIDKHIKALDQTDHVDNRKWPKQTPMLEMGCDWNTRKGGRHGLKRATWGSLILGDRAFSGCKLQLDGPELLS